MALPGWLATTVQVPRPSAVSVLPATVQTPGVDDRKATGKAEVADATSAAGAPPSVWLPGAMKWMVCAAGRTANDVATGVAAAYTLSPGCTASIVHWPAASSATATPLTLQTVGVADAKTTARPEVEVAASGAAAVPKTCSPGRLKWMLCGTAPASGSAPPPQAPSSSSAARPKTRAKNGLAA